MAGTLSHGGLRGGLGEITNIYLNRPPPNKSGPAKVNQVPPLLASTSDVSEGPVLTLLNECIRYRHRLLTQMDGGNNAGGFTKPELVAIIEELERLRLPLTAAVDKLKNTVVEKVGNNNDVAEKFSKNRSDVSRTVGGDDVAGKIGEVIEDLLKVIYFGSLFNVKMTGSLFDKTMLTRKQERSCCLNYLVDLNESDLNLLCEMSELLVSSPADSSVSHEDALRRCVEHASNWVAGSKERIGKNSNVTYAALRKKLAKITGSYYYKYTPEMKGPAEAAAVVLTVLTKRICNLRKKHNQIYNKELKHRPKYREQKNLPLLPIIIKELERLRLPLTSAVDKELKNIVSEKVGNNNDASETVGGADVAGKIGEVLGDLLKVIYFGSVFNVKMTSSGFGKTMLTRKQERNCCLNYLRDFIVDLNESDLSLLCEMSELLVSSPADSSVSHENALRRCVEHANNWVAGSKERIGKNSNVTYAELREKLAKITRSYYYKYTPESEVKRCKLEAQIEPLIEKLSGITGYNGTGRYRRRRILARRRSKVKREISNLWKEFAKQESELDQHNRWCANEEIQNLFNVALRLSFPELRDEESTVVFNIQEYGEYHCEDVLLVWPRIRKEGKRHQGPRSVGWEIKKNLRLQQSEMIEGEPWVHDIGFVTINLSGKWMAKSLHKLLKDGVDTWAPRLFIKNFVVNIYFPSCDVANIARMDLLRRELIKETLINILEYCRVSWRSMEPQEELPQEELDKFEIVKINGDMLIYPNARGEHEPLINVKRDGCSGDPLEDLKHLWHGLKNEKANWIVCLTRVQQQEYVEMCFDAARHAGWLPPRREDVPKSSYTGYQSCSTSMDELISWFEEAKATKAIQGYSEEDLMCALKYTLLKSHRLSDCTFSFEEVFNENGNTYLYLLNTQSRNRSFLKNHGKDIDELKKACELTLGEDEIWEEGVERVLVLKLLEFYEAIAMSCYPVLPHKLCEYLYDLSVRFNNYCDSSEVGIAGETKLLLCEATEVLMGKCFQLLGITRESSSFREKWLQESFGLTKSLLQSGRLNLEDPPRNPIPRFELFSVYIHVRSDSKLRNFKLFGQITISDKYGVFYDEWGVPNGPDFGDVSLFNCDWDDQIDVTNDGRLYFGNPSLSQLIPLSSSMEFLIELYGTTVKNDALYVLPVLDDCKADFAYFWKMKAETKCDVAPLKGKDGDARLYYILLKDAVDCSIEVMYNFEEGDGGEVYGQIYASYGDDFFQKNEDPLVKNYYTALLYRGCFGSKIAGNAGKVPLKRPMMAVPAKGSIVITTRLFDVDARAGILDDNCKFTAQPGGMLKQKIDGTCCSLSVSVVWSQG